MKRDTLLLGNEKPLRPKKLSDESRLCSDLEISRLNRDGMFKSRFVDGDGVASP